MTIRRPNHWLILLMLLALVGCPSQRKTSDKDVSLTDRTQLLAMIEDAKKKANLAVIDVRNPRDYAQGHIPGALNIALVDLKADDPKLAHAKTIVVYGSGEPSDLLSQVAGKKLVAMGYVNVSNFRGGIAEWLGKSKFKPPLMDRRMEDKVQQ